MWVDVSRDAVSQLDLMRSASTITLIVPVVQAVGKYKYKEGVYVFCTCRAAISRWEKSVLPTALQIGPGLFPENDKMKNWKR
jgi:hypothetical protein